MCVLRWQLQAVEVTSSQVKLKKVFVDEWTEEDNYKVGGITGLLDRDQFLHLKLDLWESASRPPNNFEIKSELIEEDPSTWTWDGTLIHWGVATIELDNLSTLNETDLSGAVSFAII